MNHTNNLRFGHRIARQIIPHYLRHYIVKKIFEHVLIPRSPDRVYLRNVLLPAVGRRGGAVLFVGCRRYTAAYPRLLERAGAKCWTIDIDPDAVRWGAPGHHVIGGIEQAGRLFPRETFDTVVLSGVFGFGLDSFDSQDAAITGVKSVIKHGGWFILGWNKDRVSDVHKLPALVNDFAPSCIQGFSEQREFADSSHVYSFYEACHHARSEAAQFGYAEAPSLLGKRP